MWHTLLGALGLTLTTDKRSYKTGEGITYSITGAIPGSTIAWTSYKNGQPTGELNVVYAGQVVDPNGTAQLSGGAWTDADAGSWIKQAIVIAPDGSQSNAEVSFSVSPAVVAPQPGSVPVSSDFFSGNVTLPVIGSVSKPVAIGGAAILAFLLFSGKRGR
jgi:hypothetical protein